MSKQELEQAPRHCGPPFNFFVPPSCGILDRTLGPWPKKVGAMGGGGREADAQAARRNPHELPRSSLLRLLFWNLTPAQAFPLPSYSLFSADPITGHALGKRPQKECWIAS